MESIHLTQVPITAWAAGWVLINEIKSFHKDDMEDTLSLHN